MAEELKPQFHTFYSNSYEALRTALSAMCRQERSRMAGECLAGAPAPWLFRKIPVIVPSRAVEADLSRHLARESEAGVTAGIGFKLLGEWLSPVSGATLGVSSRGEELEWLVWKRLLDRKFLEKDTSESLKRYLTGQDGRLKSRSDASRYELALKIAAAFTKYASYRFDWIHQWSFGGGQLGNRNSPRGIREAQAFAKNEAMAAWQRDIWRWLSQRRDEADPDSPRRWDGMREYASLADKMTLQDLASDPDAGMALHVFAPSALPPLMLPFLFEKSLKDPVYLYLLNPSEEFWFEPGDWCVARRHFESLPDGGRLEDPAAPACAWLRRNAGQTRALIERIWRFTTAEAAEELEVEDDAEGRAGAVKPVREPMGLDPGSPLQDLEVHVDDPDTVLKVDLAALAGHGAGEDCTRRTLLDAVHEAVSRNQTDFLADPDYGALHPEELALYRQGEPAGELPSIRIARAATLRREAEGLADWIYALREKGIKADEILVATPDLEKSAAAVNAVFSALPASRRIEYAVSGRAAGSASPALAAFLALGDFLYGCASALDFEALLSDPVIARSWKLEGDDAERVCGWLAAAGYRRGISAEQLRSAVALGLASDEGEDEEEPEATLERAIERLAAGLATDCGGNCDRAWQDVRPVLGGSGGWGRSGVVEAPELFERLIAFSRALEAASGILFSAEAGAPGEKGASAEAWDEAFSRILGLFFPEDGSWWQDPDLEALKGLVGSFFSTAIRTFRRAGLRSERIPFPVLWKAFKNRTKQSGRAAKADGRVLITSMDAMRGIPFKAIAVLGLDSDSSFPGTTRLEEFDLMGKDGLKRRGDRDSRRDNRNIFFDLVMSAREHLAIFYAAGQNKEKAAPPSEVVSDLEELLEEIESSAGLPEEKRGGWRLDLPQTFFSRRNFTEEAAGRAALGSSRAAHDALARLDEAGVLEDLPDFAPRAQCDEKAPEASREGILAGLASRLGAPVERRAGRLGLGGPAYESGELPLSVLAAYLKDPERFALQLAGIARVAPEPMDKGASRLEREAANLDGYALRAEARRARDAGVSPEQFNAVRSLDPVYGARAVRKWQIAEQSAEVFNALAQRKAWEMERSSAGCSSPEVLELRSFSGRKWRLTSPGRRFWTNGYHQVSAVFEPISEGEIWRSLIDALFISAGHGPDLGRIRGSLYSLSVREIAKAAVEARAKQEKYEEAVRRYEEQMEACDRAEEAGGRKLRRPRKPAKPNVSAKAFGEVLCAGSAEARLALTALVSLFEALVDEGRVLPSIHVDSPFYRGRQEKKAALLDCLDQLKKDLHALLENTNADNDNQKRTYLNNRRNVFPAGIWLESGPKLTNGPSDSLSMWVAQEALYLLKAIGSAQVQPPVDFSAICERCRREAEPFLGRPHDQGAPWNAGLSKDCPESQGLAGGRQKA